MKLFGILGVLVLLVSCGTTGSSRCVQRQAQVYLATQGLSPVFEPALAEAMQRWNQAVGHAFFRLQRKRERPVLYVRSDAWTFEQRRALGFFAAPYVVLKEDLPETLRLPVLVHKLGHALGLAHSADPASVMYPNTDPGKSFVPTAEDVRNAQLAFKLISSLVCE